MSLFQKTVVQKYSNTLTKSTVEQQWQLYSTIFHNVTKQDNIRNSKEEQYQEGFLRELFVQVLGYTLNPDPDYNLITEQKNETNSKKADGAIILNDNVHAVIELKGTDTTDLGKIESQAFGYKNNQKNCTYVIISNFEKLRFYIDNATEFLEFNLFKLSREEFNTLWLCLSLESIQNDLPKKIKNESVSNEDKITKDLYKDYSAFRTELFADIEQLNPQYDRLVLFKKTQKLLDRFLFIFFAEDRQLLPTNLIFSINLEWEKLREARVTVSLYDRYKMYFNDLNTGARVSLPAFGKHTNEIVTAQYDIYAYNGGLFQTDALLDAIAITDDLLYKHTRKLSDYDFESEVDVNILGHIFENSLNEIDEITNAAKGEVTDKTKTKRKKDGVFYTPKYITKYIVDNTIGKLCEEKKAEIALDETKYTTDKRITVTTKKKLIETLDHYRKWLLQLTIVDPACGSGAFLNQALEFLIAEHRYVDELQAKLFGDTLVLSDVEGSILENNLFGVDLNEESVEIAKLSLWLRTAQRHRKLNSLNNNIKCGNSLIEDPAVAGDKAFSWEKEFPQVFAKGGFDVVIGNPPYVNANDIKKNSTSEEYKYLKSKFRTAKGTVDLYIYFFEKGLKITKKSGLLAYITPNRFLSASYGKAFREILLKDYKLISLIDYSDKNVFIDASTYPVITFIKNDIALKKYDLLTGKFDETSKELISNYYPSDKLNILDESILGFLLNNKISLTLKVFSQSEPLDNCGKINATSTASEAESYSELINEEIGYKLINTGTIDPYFSFWGFNYLTDKGKKYLFPYLPKDSTTISKNRHNLYSSKKIVISKIGLQCEAFYDKNGEFASINTNCIYNFSDSYLPEYLLCWLNSKLYNFTFECLFDGLRMSGGYLLFSAPNLKNTKIKKISKTEQLTFIEKADLMLTLNKSLQEVSGKFSKYLSGQFKLEKLSGKLEKWYEQSFEDFIKEISKAVKANGGTPLTKKDEFEWMELFEDKKKEAQSLKTQIDKTDKEIDQMVYALYGLTEEEIKIVEQS
ncbi:Eco57I restriction-modification methylase domain-containing protein [Flavobacterium phycosphaerae]|uniref:Eco57I restriction-modification methylase domain-containing protein n=1 Tax=Flavobacterium phycosphaerae TaxID=2697515 RepID=UPI001389980A|nr:DNA methyltransferase [Flavobacterium phycosphaerae]